MPIDFDAIADEFCSADRAAHRAVAEQAMSMALLAFRIARESFSNVKDTKRATRNLRKKIASLEATLRPAGNWVAGEVVDLQDPSAADAPDTAEVIALIDFNLGVGFGARLRAGLAIYASALDSLLVSMPQRGKPVDEPRYSLAYNLIGPYRALTGLLPNAKFHGADQSTAAGETQTPGSENRYWRFLNAVNAAHRSAIAVLCRTHYPEKSQREVDAICDEYDLGAIRPALDWAVKRARRRDWQDDLTQAVT